MRFHISSHHTPDNCAVHRGDGTAPVTDWRARCKEVGIEFVAGGSCPPCIAVSCLLKPTIW